MAGVVFLPALGSKAPEVVMDGKTVTGVLEGKFIRLDGIGSGTHRFERRR
jgi:hypothetical protein